MVLLIFPVPAPRKTAVASEVPAEVPAAAAITEVSAAAVAAEVPAAGTAGVCTSVGGFGPAGSPMPMGGGSAMFAEIIVLMYCVWEGAVCWETCWYVSEKTTDGKFGVVDYCVGMYMGQMENGWDGIGMVRRFITVCWVEWEQLREMVWNGAGIRKLCDGDGMGTGCGTEI